MLVSDVVFRKRPSLSGPSKSRSKPARHKGIWLFLVYKGMSCLSLLFCASFVLCKQNLSKNYDGLLWNLVLICGIFKNCGILHPLLNVASVSRV